MSNQVKDSKKDCKKKHNNKNEMSSNMGSVPDSKILQQLLSKVYFYGPA